MMVKVMLFVQEAQSEAGPAEYHHAERTYSMQIPGTTRVQLCSLDMFTVGDGLPITNSIHAHLCLL